jgi:hypothetical protein
LHLINGMNLLLVFVAPLLQQGVVGMHNVTIDDTDLSILYSGDWNTSADDTQNGLDYGGSHHVSNDPDATATWNFTGQLEYQAR